VQTVAQQFQAQRNQLIAALTSTTDATQRAAILGQLQSLRDQLQQQLQSIATQARNQAQQMQQQFGPQRRPDLGGTGGTGGNSGSTSPGGGRPRN
jgi:glutamate-1-semialdehyde aminotransferase